MLGFLSEGLALLRAVDAAEANAFRLVVVEDFEGVAVEATDYLAEKVNGKRGFDGEKLGQLRMEIDNPLGDSQMLRAPRCLLLQTVGGCSPAFTARFIDRTLSITGNGRKEAHQ